MASNEVQKLAEKIAKVLDPGSNNSELASLFASIEKINHRLDKLESVQKIPNSALLIPQSIHPSLDKFSVAEAVADAFIEAKSKEKACTFEPNAKPCDHCAMCSSRGF